MIREKQAVLEEDIQQPVLQQQQQQQQAGGKICPFCGAVNEPEAMFCAQCGHPISKSSCPFCGAEVDPDADFCEACHRYIRKDICSYCGAKLKGNEAYCPECGSPRGGLVCPTCHTMNDFAFCKKCGTALTAEAKEMLKELQKNPDYKELLDVVQEYSNLESSLPYNSERDIVKEQRNYRLFLTNWQYLPHHHLSKLAIMRWQVNQWVSVWRGYAISSTHFIVVHVAAQSHILEVNGLYLGKIVRKK